MEERDIDRELPISLAVCPIELAVIFSRDGFYALCAKAVETAGILRSPERFADGLRLAVAGIDAGKHIELIDPVYRKLYRFLFGNARRLDRIVEDIAQKRYQIRRIHKREIRRSYIVFEAYPARIADRFIFVEQQIEELVLCVAKHRMVFYIAVDILDIFADCGIVRECFYGNKMIFLVMRYSLEHLVLLIEQGVISLVGAQSLRLALGFIQLIELLGGSPVKDKSQKSRGYYRD